MDKARMSTTRPEHCFEAVEKSAFWRALGMARFL
jgi:hypothetical protein